MSTPHELGDFVWHELMSNSPEASIRFYEKLFGWTHEVRDMGGGAYHLLKNGEVSIAGVVPVAPEEDQATHWLAYVEVDDVDSSVALARTLGGEVLDEPRSLPDVGRFAVIADPRGAALALFASAAPSGSSQPEGRGSFCWHELMTDDIEESKGFYTKLLRWGLRANAIPEAGEYTMFTGDGDRTLGGVLPIYDETPHPPLWICYVQVDEVDTLTVSARELGGRVLVPPTDLPKLGRFSVLSDPQGASFAIWAPTKR